MLTLAHSTAFGSQQRYNSDPANTLHAKSGAGVLDPIPIVRWTIERQCVRQMPLKSLQQLDRLAKDLGVRLSRNEKLETGVRLDGMKQAPPAVSC